MSEDNRDDLALTAELASLRAALRDVRAPASAEAALLAAYRARLGARAPLSAAARRPLRPFALVAVALLVAVTALLALRADRAERGAAPAADRAAAAAPALPRASGAFRPLAFARGVSATESYSVVRVRIQVPTLAPGVGGPAVAAIEADLLVGEDGLARAIRFDEADTLFVSNAASGNGERR